MRTTESLNKNTNYVFHQHFQIILIIIAFSLFAGCAVQPTYDSALNSELEGKWSWKQDPWHGYFVLKKSGNSYTGTLDDVFEGTYGDSIKDVELSENDIKFTRDGNFGIQYWQGTLKVEDGLLKIVDGQWKKATGSSGSFYAEKID